MSDTLKLKYKVGEIEFEAEGPADAVEQHVGVMQRADRFAHLGQLEQRLCADDLAGGRCLRGVVPGQKAQIFQVVPDLFGLCTHGVLQIM